MSNTTREPLKIQLQVLISKLGPLEVIKGSDVGEGAKAKGKLMIHNKVFERCFLFCFVCKLWVSASL